MNYRLIIIYLIIDFIIFEKVLTLRVFTDRLNIEELYLIDSSFFTFLSRRMYF